MSTAVTRTDRNYGEMGPCMQALSPKYRTFVEHYVLETFRNNNRGNYGAQAYAARAAGFGGANSRPLTLAQAGYKLMRDPRIQAAIAEESRNMRRNAAPEVVKAWLNVIRDPEHPGHIRAIGMGLDRDEPLVTQQKVDVTHTHVDRNQEEIEELRALRELGTSRQKLEELFGANGLARLEALEAADAARNARVIEGEAVEIQEEPNNGSTQARRGT